MGTPALVGIAGAPRASRDEPKAGNWTRWCRQNIPAADDLFDDHLRTLKGE